MIDILLVLLIIFMVIVPVTPKGLDALVPQPPKDPARQPPPRPTAPSWCRFCTSGLRVPTYKINDTDVPKAELLPRLTEIYANRAERIMFVKGDDDLNFALCGRGH
jgi:biopolymer transport protein TolR